MNIIKIRLNVLNVRHGCLSDRTKRLSSLKRSEIVNVCPELTSYCKLIHVNMTVS